MERISSRIAYVATALCFALITAATPRVTLAEPELPVLLARANQSKVMLLIDDTGSMQAGMVHPGYDVNDPLNADTTYRMPMFIFRVNSGAAAAATSHTVTPILLALQRGYYDNRATTAGTLWDTTKTLSQISTHKAIALLKKSGTTSGINSTRLFRLPTNPAITGATVFNVTNVATFGGVPVRDAAQNEFFFFDVDCTGTATYVDAMCSTSYPEDFAHTFPRFDAFGAIVENKKQRFYGSMGGTIYFEGKTIPLARGFYEEKYLRWLLYFATPTQLTELPQETRIEATRRIVRTLIQNNPTIAFGISSFNGTRWTNTVTNYDVVDMIRHPLGDHTAGYYPVIRANIGDDQATLLNVVNQIGASNGTPPHAAFVEVMRYFDARGANRYKYFGKDRYSGVDYASSPITSECDAHFVVMLTDGIPMSDCRNKFDRGAGEANIPDIDGDPDPGYPATTCIDGWEQYLDDAAFLARIHDFSPLPGTQSLTSFAIGLGLNFDLLNDFASDGGSGTAYRADTVEELEDAFDSIINLLVTTPVAGAGVALAETVGSETRVFRPTFFQTTWRGTIDVFALVDGNLEFQYDMGRMLEERDLGASPRRILAGSDPDGDGITNSMIDFDATNASILRPQLFRRFIAPGTEDPTDLADPIENVADDDAAATLIRYVGGMAFDDLRSRDYDADGSTEKLGDIIYSRPVEVGPVNGVFHGLDGYTDWTASRRSQPTLVLVGANDGMLHAFNSNTGEELWAYVPANLLPKLEYLTREDYNLGWHRYFVDGLILVQDAWVDGGWKTLAIFGQREGGAAYTVLDITDRANPTLLFEVSDPVDIGQSWNMPSVVKKGGTVSSTSGADFTWYLSVSSGEGRTAAGTKLSFYPLQSGAPVKTTLALESTSLAGTRASAILWVNDDRDLNDDRGYVGTEDGDMFRIGIGSGAPNTWTVTKIFDSDANFPIVATPAAVLAENPQYVESGTGQASLEYATMVSFGSGRYDMGSDISWAQTHPQRIVGLFDPVNTTSDTLANALTATPLTSMQQQNVGFHAIRRTPDKKILLPLGKKGFFMNLDTAPNLTSDQFIDPVGMVLHQPMVARGAMVYSTFLPNDDICGIGGMSFLQAVDFRTGGGVVIDGLGEQPINARYAGGILDYDGNSNYNSTDVSYGLQQGMIEIVTDMKVDTVDLADPERPYRHNNILNAFDVRLHPTNGGILPSVSSLGNAGAPSPPVLSYAGEIVIVQNAFVVPPEFGTGGGDEDDNHEPPSTQQFNLYSIPPKLLSFHEVVRD